MQITERREDGKKPQKPEIDQYMMKLIVAFIAFSLPVFTDYFSSIHLTSISESYWEGGWSQTIFIGFLFAIASFLLAYNGDGLLEAGLSKVAAIAAVCVAMFPCGCDGYEEIYRYAHWGSALVMFSVLAWLCVIFGVRAWKKDYSRARRRAKIYFACGGVIVAAMALLGYDGLSEGSLSAKRPTFTYWAETVALGAFGLSWFIASHLLRWLLFSEEEQYIPFKKMPTKPSIASADATSAGGAQR
jgi:hypothetical protein